MKEKETKKEKRQGEVAEEERSLSGAEADTTAGAAQGESAPPAAGGAGSAAGAESDELREKLKQAEEKSREYLSDLQRLKAEFDNYRKRMLREQTALIESASRELVEKLLPVIDNLERALASAAEGAADGMAEGVRMVLSQLMEILRQEGLEEINPEGHPFDPQECEAVNAVVSDDHEDETVLEVHQKGYRFKGRLLRPAMATVSKCREGAGGSG